MFYVAMLVVYISIRFDGLNFSSVFVCLSYMWIFIFFCSIDLYQLIHFVKFIKVIFRI